MAVGSGWRRGWRPDLRAVAGAALVVASGLGVAALVSDEAPGAEVYAARHALLPGELLLPADVRAVPMPEGPEASRYLSAGQLPAEGVRVGRIVGEGELIPLAAIGRADAARLAAVVLPVGGGRSSAVVTGAAVDVWAVPGDLPGSAVPSGETQRAAMIAEASTVVRVLEETGLVGGGEHGVEVLVDRDDLPRVLTAVAAGDVLTLVPRSIPVED